MGNKAASVVKLEAFRAIRLDSSGVPDVGAKNQIVVRAPIQLQYTPQAEARESFKQKNGAGVVCVDFEGDPNPVDSVDLATQFCQLDVEVMELLCGGAVLANGGDDLGYDAATQATINSNGCSVEGWALAWNGTQRLQLAGEPAYWKYVWPLTRWEESDQTTLSNGLTIIALKGVGTPNSNFTHGLGEDPMPWAIGDTAMRRYLTSSIPDDTGGYASVVAS